MNLSKIIKQRRRELELTLKDIADEMDVSEATVQRYESGNIKNLRHNRISDLARALKMSPAELMGWETLPTVDNIFDIPGIIPIKVKSIPLLGDVSCGVPTFADEEFQQYVAIGADVNADFALHAKGDSMIGARILDGDLVLVQQQTIVEDGEIAVVLIDDETTLKRFHRYGDMVVLRAENPAYEEIQIRLDESSNVKILGKAIAFQSDVR